MMLTMCSHLDRLKWRNYCAWDVPVENTKLVEESMGRLARQVTLVTYKSITPDRSICQSICQFGKKKLPKPSIFLKVRRQSYYTICEIESLDITLSKISR